MKYKLINYCEFDKYAKKAYSLIHNESEDKNLGDITQVNEKEIKDFNMMVGGSPCQDFSVAGKGEGAVWTCKDCKDKNGNNYQYNPLEVHYTKRDKCPQCNSSNIEKTRSSLVVEWLRILHEKKPNLAIYENVKNLVGKKHKYFFDLFVAELQEYGYNTYWKVLNAKDYGIPQNRERVYLIIIKKELDNGKFKFPEGFDNNIRLKDILSKEVDEKYYISQDKVDKLLSQIKDNEWINKNANYTPTENTALYPIHSQEFVRTGFMENCPTLRQRDYKDPMCVVVGNTNPSGNGMNGNVYSEEGLAPTLTTNKGEGNKILQVGNIVDTGNFENPQRGRIYSPDGICPALNTCGGGGLEPKILEDFYSNRDIREYEEYSPTLRADRQGLKVVEGLQYTRKGSPKKVDVCNTLTANDKEAIENISSEYQFAKDKCIEYYNKYGHLPEMFNPYNQAEVTDVAPTQTTSCNRSCSSATVLIKDIHYRIRKLTPFECFKLMGFSEKDYYILENNKISNSQCYKMAGNSIVVDVIYYILIELYKAMPYLLEDIKLSSFFSGIGAFEKAIIRLQNKINEITN